MTIHELKTWMEQFREVKYGQKTFEIRWNDRDYKVGDYLLLREYDTEKKEYSGDKTLVKVAYIMDTFPCKGVVDGFVVMSIEKTE